MLRVFAAALLALALCCLAPSASACLWDNDTLMMERMRFPGTLDVITGKFPRHSRAFYEWRLRDRLPKIDGTPATRMYIDDVAVAFDKTGRGDMAILAMVLKEQIAPGEYETSANLGTFLFHRGDFEAGLPFIEQALRINPKAHFGREEYQKLLVEYVIATRKAGNRGLPLRGRLPGDSRFRGRVDMGVPPMPGGFARFLKDRGRNAGPKAVKGILGMMRFGNHDSPVLLEALGDLLMAPYNKDDWKKNATQNAWAHQSKDAKRLATRAYLKASYTTHQADQVRASEAYRRHALASIQSQSSAPGAGAEPLNDVEDRLMKEIEEAERYLAGVARDEKLWIDNGLDVEKQFGWKYFKAARP
jgi:hypothetical protein